MKLITVLLLSYTLNGQTESVHLLSPSMQSCSMDKVAATAIIDYMGGTDVSTSCITRFE